MDIKKIIFFSCGILFFCLCCKYSDQVWANTKAQPAIYAKSAIVMDVDTGQILFEHDSAEPRPMASTTKVMTALVALAGADVKSIATVSPKADAVGESSMHLSAGEKLTLEQLLYGALVRSGNDACVAVAEHVAGSEENFLLIMNEKAALMGAKATKFINTNGLPATGHQSCARDLAMITRYALLDPYFNKMIKTKYIEIFSQRGEGHYLKNTNKLLWIYPGADGVKTGTTDAAGKCLIATASKENRRLLVVLLNSPDRFGDARRLLDYGFQSFTQNIIVGSGQLTARVQVLNGAADVVAVANKLPITAYLSADGSDLVEQKWQLPAAVCAPITRGQALGQVAFFVNGRPIAAADLIATADVEQKMSLTLWIDQFKMGVARNLKL